MEGDDGRVRNNFSESKPASANWMEDWNAEFGIGNSNKNIGGNSMGKMVRDLRRQERTDMRNRFLSIDMDAKVGAAAAVVI